MSKANPPVTKIRIGNITATVWLNNETFFSVVLSKSYKDGSDWKETDQLNHGDLLNAAKVLQRAEEWIGTESKPPH
jgi:hypothetical protein